MKDKFASEKLRKFILERNPRLPIEHTVKKKIHGQWVEVKVVKPMAVAFEQYIQSTASETQMISVTKDWAATTDKVFHTNQGHYHKQNTLSGPPIDGRVKWK